MQLIGPWQLDSIETNPISGSVKFVRTKVQFSFKMQFIVSETMLPLCNNAFQTIFSFFQNQNSAGFHNFDLFKWNHSAKKRKFHKKNRKTVYMLKKWALLRVYGGMRKIKVGIYCSYFWGLQFLYNFLPLQVVKTGGREKRTVLVTFLLY